MMGEKGEEFDAEDYVRECLDGVVDWRAPLHEIDILRYRIAELEQQLKAEPMDELVTRLREEIRQCHDEECPCRICDRDISNAALQGEAQPAPVDEPAAVTDEQIVQAFSKGVPEQYLQWMPTAWIIQGVRSVLAVLQGAALRGNDK